MDYPFELGHVDVATEELREAITAGDHVVGLTLEYEDGAVGSLIVDRGTKQHCESVAAQRQLVVPAEPKVRHARWFIFEMT